MPDQRSPLSYSDSDLDDVPLSAVANTARRRGSRKRPHPSSSRAGTSVGSELSPSEGNSASVAASPSKKPRRGQTPNGRQRGNSVRGDTKRRKASRAPKKEEDIIEPNGLNGTTDGGNFDEGEDQGDQAKWWESRGDDKSSTKWTTLVHHGLLFPPAYEPHGVPLVYRGEPLQLEPRGEEVATFYAAKLGTDYVQKGTFNANFFRDFRASLKGTPAYRVVKKLEHCDFSRIHQMLEEKKAEKKALPAAEKKRLKEEEKKKLAKYEFALVDGREEKIGNYRVEPPGLFLGRGEHPKMGQVKKRVYPEDIIINIGKDAPIPEPLPGHNWKEVVHKQDVTWLAGYKCSITGGHKYVWLSAGSHFKGMSDHAKFEKARKLEEHIKEVRRDYMEGWDSKEEVVRQRAVVMYLIDKLALRVGNEKGEDEADTVGCCSLRVEHIRLLENNVIEFDFLGKDSIRYLNEVTVERKVHRNLKQFCQKKNPKDLIFDKLSTIKLNDYLKSIMSGLSAKVFRTYNASKTLSGLLGETPSDIPIHEKIVFYNKSNKEVAILCNHQRALPKAHGAQMEKLEQKKQDLEEWIAELNRAKKKFAKKKAPDTVEVVQKVPMKPEYTPEMTDEQRAVERKRVAELPMQEKTLTRSKDQISNLLKAADERLAKLSANMTVKEELKTVALGTSKINYLDPRITVAWCKKFDVPIEKVFPKTLLVKFAWAMETSQNFKF